MGGERRKGGGREKGGRRGGMHLFTGCQLLKLHVYGGSIHARVINKREGERERGREGGEGCNSMYFIH